MPIRCRAPLPDFQLIANTKILGPVPILVVVMLAVLAVIYWMLRSTSFGRNVYAVGGDYEVAKYSGINVQRTKAATYLICGLTAALGGVMLASQLNSASSTRRGEHGVVRRVRRGRGRHVGRGRDRRGDQVGHRPGSSSAS